MFPEMTSNTPVKLEFKTTEFIATPLSASAKKKILEAGNKKGAAVNAKKAEMKRAAANARALSHLLDKKEKAKKVGKRVQQVKARNNRAKASIQASIAESVAAAAVRRLSLRSNLLDRVDKHNEKVARISLKKMEEDVIAREENAKKLEQKLANAMERQASLTKMRAEQAGAAVIKAKELAQAKKERAEKKIMETPQKGKLKRLRTFIPNYTNIKQSEDGSESPVPDSSGGRPPNHPAPHMRFNSEMMARKVNQSHSGNLTPAPSETTAKSDPPKHGQDAQSASDQPKSPVLGHVLRPIVTKPSPQAQAQGTMQAFLHLHPNSFPGAAGYGGGAGSPLSPVQTQAPSVSAPGANTNDGEYVGSPTVAGQGQIAMGGLRPTFQAQASNLGNAGRTMAVASSSSMQGQQTEAPGVAAGRLSSSMLDYSPSGSAFHDVYLAQMMASIQLAGGMGGYSPLQAQVQAQAQAQAQALSSLSPTAGQAQMMALNALQLQELQLAAAAGYMQAQAQAQAPGLSPSVQMQIAQAQAQAHVPIGAGEQAQLDFAVNQYLLRKFAGYEN